jgi:hypothetical protein
MNTMDVFYIQQVFLGLQEVRVLVLDHQAEKVAMVQLELHFINKKKTWQI